MKLNLFVFYTVIFFSLNIRAYSQTITVPNSNPTTTRSLCSYFFNQGVGVAFSDWVFPSNPTNLVVDNSSGMPYSSGIYDLNLYVKWKNISNNAKPQTIKAEYLIGSGKDYKQITVGPFALTMPPPSFISGTSINISCYDTNPVTIMLNPYINTGESSKYIDENETITNYFEWTLPIGWHTTSGQTGTFVSSSSISVIPESSISSTSISVRGYANSQRGEIATLQITRNIEAFSISGPINVYFNSINRYTVPLIPGFSYSWQIPSGWQSSGSTTNSIDVLANCSIGNITCIMTGCNQTKSSVLPIISNTLNSGTIISGSSIVCSSGATFIITNLPPVNSIVWTPGPNLTISSGQNTASCTFSVIGSGSSWVRARLVTGCGDITLPDKNVWIGSPSTPTVITGFGANGIEFGQNSIYEFGVYPPTTQGITSYQWQVGGGTIVSGQGTDLITIRTAENLTGIRKYFDVRVRVGNSCSLSGYLWRSGFIGTGIGPMIVISPNPATSQTSIQLVSDSKENLTEETGWELEIYDSMQSLKEKKIQIKGNQTKLNTTNWKDGVYIVRAKIGEEILSEKLVVKH